MIDVHTGLHKRFDDPRAEPILVFAADGHTAARSSSKKFSSTVTRTEPFCSPVASGLGNTEKRLLSGARSTCPQKNSASVSMFW